MNPFCFIVCTNWSLLESRKGLIMQTISCSQWFSGAQETWTLLDGALLGHGYCCCLYILQTTRLGQCSRGHKHLEASRKPLAFPSADDRLQRTTASCWFVGHGRGAPGLANGKNLFLQIWSCTCCMRCELLRAPRCFEHSLSPSSLGATQNGNSSTPFFFMPTS